MKSERCGLSSFYPSKFSRKILQTAGLSAFLMLALAGVLQATTLPANFQDTVVFSGLTNPTAVRFGSDGRVFVAEKSGIIKVFNSLSDTTPDIFVDLRTNVFDHWDRGLLGLALDPQFPQQPFVYVLYTYDAEIGGTAPRWNDNCPTPPGDTADGCMVSGRLSRMQISSTNTLVGSEQVLITNDWCQQYPSHSIGSLNFGPEGALYVSAGDGASFNFTDYGQAGGGTGSPTPKNPCGDPPVPVGGTQTPPTAEGGALRSQDIRTSGDPVTSDGTMLRINPATGAAWVGNPLIGSDPQDDRIIAYGLRNPFRFTMRPGTNEAWIGDVGWGTWEEINRLTSPSSPVDNFGWPCYEGSLTQSGYDSTNLNICEGLYSQGSAVLPYYTYNHSSDVDPNGDGCRTGSSSVSGLAFYGQGVYPVAYQDALFFADYSRDCIYIIRKGANGDPDLATRTAFGIDAFNPVDLEIGPGGDLFYVDLGGNIRRISYFTANQPPTAAIQANPTSGPPPLLVQFDGSGSSDPNPGATLFYQWDFDGDGQFDSTISNPAYTYNTVGQYTVQLKVTDDDGAFDTEQVVISVGNTPPTATILTPSPTLTWRVGDTISFSGQGTDQQDGQLQSSAMQWDIILNHCPGGTPDCHQHIIQHYDGISQGSFVAPDHEYLTYFDIRFTVTDSGGLSNQTSVTVYPQTVTFTFQTNPTGLRLSVGGIEEITPFNRPAIIGSLNTISAPSPQTLGSSQYTWVSWSDGGAQSHEVLAGDTPATYVASYATSCGYSISPTNQTFPPNGGTGTVNVSTAPGCSWSAVSNNNWITITSGSSGNGNGVVGYSVAANPANQKRTGTMTIAGRTFTVKQNKRGR